MEEACAKGLYLREESESIRHVAFLIVWCGCDVMIQTSLETGRGLIYVHFSHGWDREMDGFV